MADKVSEQIAAEAHEAIWKPVREARKQEENKMLAEYRKHSRSCVEDAVRDFGHTVVMAWVEDAPERDDSPDCMDIARDFRLAEGQ